MRSNSKHMVSKLVSTARTPIPETLRSSTSWRRKSAISSSLSGAGAIEVREDVAEQFYKEMQARLSQTAWDKVTASWYKDGDRITNNWPGSSWEYYRRTRRVDPSHYIAADIYKTNA